MSETPTIAPMAYFPIRCGHEGCREAQLIRMDPGRRPGAFPTLPLTRVLTGGLSLRRIDGVAAWRCEAHDTDGDGFAIHRDRLRVHDMELVCGGLHSAGCGCTTTFGLSTSVVRKVRINGDALFTQLKARRWVLATAVPDMLRGAVLLDPLCPEHAAAMGQELRAEGISPDPCTS